MKVKCPNCNKKIEITKENLFCSKCDYQITIDDLKNMKSGKTSDSKKKAKNALRINCPNCHKKTQITKENLVCSNCKYQITKTDLQDILAERNGWYDDEFSRKNSDTAGLLCLCLGPFGVHRFYLEKYISGTLMLLLTLSIYFANIIGFIGVFWAYIFMYMWWLVDIACSYYGIFNDGKGKPLRSEPSESEQSNPLLICLIFLCLAIIFALASLANIGLTFYLNAAICFAVCIGYLIKAIK